MDPRDVLSRPGDGPDLVVRYADHSDALIDVFRPPGATRGSQRLAVVLHGGFWRQEYDRTHLRPLAWGLAAAGFVVATPEYRRGPDSWPAMSQDVEAGLAAVRDLIDEASPGLIDPAAPYVLAGHSAGGHLALWGGQRTGPDAIAHIVALAPVTDPVYAARTGMGGDAAQELLGGQPADQAEAYQAVDAVGSLRGRVPVTLIQGDADQQVPVAMNRELATTRPADTGEAGFRYIELPGVDHFALIDPESEAWPTVLRAVTSRS